MSELERAMASHRAGDLVAAERGYRRVLARGGHAEAHQLLGVLLHRKGAAAEALEHLDAALALDGEHPGALANRGLVLLALDRPHDAEGSFRRALAVRPDLLAARLNLARLCMGSGRLSEAAEVLRGVEQSEARRLLGMVHLQLGDIAAAWAAWSEAFEAEQDPALGRALGQLALQRGRPQDAVTPLVRALCGGQPVGPLLADALVQGASLHDPAVLARLLADPSVDAQRVEPVVARAVERAEFPIASELLRPWLTHTVVSRPSDRARLHGWIDAAREAEDVGLAEALAVQAWLTEHADPPGLSTLTAVERLPEGLLREALLAACRPPSGVSDALPALHRVVVAEAAEEEALAASIPALTPIRDATSQTVAAMYEQHPYPRRVGVHRPDPQQLASRLRALGLAPPTERPLKVLVAGAGTGQHPLQTVARYADVEVLAIDLSRRSLARGLAIARRHGLGARVRFAQADLLALELEERFDVIESVGVLHHLAEPQAGFRSLLRHLGPGGALRIGLYSERGRQDVVAARALVRQWGLAADRDGLMEARRRLLELPTDHPARPVVHSPDFPSSTGLRDLVFHPMEHRFTPASLETLLKGLGLRFLGFQHPRPEPARWYAERWPEDTGQRSLARWGEVERAHPRAFSGMFVFWCARA